jgi:hypothetical protein
MASLPGVAQGLPQQQPDAVGVANPGVEVSGQHLVEGQARFGKDRLFGQPPFA